MGNGLARKVAAEWGPRLNGNAFKVVSYMAWRALDRPNEEGRPACLYFAGIEPLILALRGEIPEAGTRARKAAERRVYDALQSAEDAGALQRLEDHPHTKVRQTYRLTLDRVTETVTHSMTETVTQQGDGNRHNSMTETVTPRKEEEDRAGEESRNESSSSLPHVQAAREGADDERHPESRSKRCIDHPAMTVPCVACRATGRPEWRVA